MIKHYTPGAKAAYSDAERVAVTTYSSLFNTNPFFEDPEIIIADDAHAAENYIASQWTVRISRTMDADKGLFKVIVGVLKGALPEGSYARLVGDARSVDDAGWVDKIPTHKLVAIAGELHAAIAENIDGTEQRYARRMIGDHLHTCQLYVQRSR